jgi:hypothetical protein
MTTTNSQKLNDRRDTVLNISKTTLVNVGAVSTVHLTKHACTTNRPSRIHMEQRDKGGEAVQDKHRDKVRDLAFLRWQLHANEGARASGLITAAMYEFARDALHKDIAILEALCYTDSHKVGGDSGFEVCSTTTRYRALHL